MVKVGLGLLAGLAIGISIIFVIESFGHALFPAPAQLDITDPRSREALGASIPLGAKICDLIAWTLGIFGGGLAGGLVAGHRATIAWLVGLVIFGISAMTLMLLPYPQWMINGAIVCAIFAAGLAGQIATHAYNKT